MLTVEATCFFSPMMSNQSDIELLRAAYTAFNTRDLDAVLALMTSDVHWPRAFKGGFVRGPEEVRAYWIEQGNEINAHVEPVSFTQKENGQILVDVHQIVRDPAGTVLSDEHVGHRYSFKDGLIQGMEIASLPSSDSNT